MYNKVELCGVDTAQLPVLSEAEKRQLLTRARAGDAAARQAMIEGNLRLVLSVVQRFAQRGENLDDLFQVGCIGLIKAIDNFDPAQPVRFSTYGVPMIIGEIRRFLRDNNALRVSRSLRDAAYKAMQARETLEKQLGREPTVDEVARQAGLSRREVNAALESVVEPLSLEEPLYPAGGAATCRARPRWRWRGRSASARRRSPGWKRPRWSSSGTNKQESGTGLPAPLSYFLYLRLVAAPPRRWRSALLRASTACTRANRAASTARRRVDTSLCTVDLLHPNARAAARTVALCSAMYSPSSAARCSGSTFIRSRLPCLRSP